jgi:hypothetical protein
MPDAARQPLKLSLPPFKVGQIGHAPGYTLMDDIPLGNYLSLIRTKTSGTA